MGGGWNEYKQKDHARSKEVVARDQTSEVPFQISQREQNATQWMMYPIPIALLGESLEEGSVAEAAKFIVLASGCRRSVGCAAQKTEKVDDDGAHMFPNLPCLS